MAMKAITVIVINVLAPISYLIRLIKAHKHSCGYNAWADYSLMKIQTISPAR